MTAVVGLPPRPNPIFENQPKNLSDKPVFLPDSDGNPNSNPNASDVKW